MSPCSASVAKIGDSSDGANKFVKSRASDLICGMLDLLVGKWIVPISADASIAIIHTSSTTLRTHVGAVKGIGKSRS